MIHEFLSNKLPRDFMVKKDKDYISPLEHLAKKHNVSIANVIHIISDFIKEHPQSSLKPYLKRKLKIVLAKDFREFKGTRDEFTDLYGISEKYFVKLMKEVIEDTTILSDNYASNLYAKLTRGHNCKVSCIPVRIVRIVGEYYVNPTAGFTQEVLGRIYDISESSVAGILRRGISESIYDDCLADKVYAKVCACRYLTSETKALYIKAFELREV